MSGPGNMHGLLGKAAKFCIALLISIVPALVITDIAYVWYWMQVSDPGCHCYVERISLARVAHESHYKLTAVTFDAVAVLFAFALAAVPWTKIRIAEFFLALGVGTGIWFWYGSATTFDVSSERWFVLPIHQVTPAPFSELCNIVAPVLTMQFVYAFLPSLALVLLCEGIAWIVKRRRRAKTAGTEPAQAQ